MVVAFSSGAQVIYGNISSPDHLPLMAKGGYCPEGSQWLQISGLMGQLIRAGP